MRILQAQAGGGQISIAVFAIVIALTGFSCSTVHAQSDSHDSNRPPFSDTAGTVFDIIQTTDASSFSCLEDAGTGERQIWDKRVNGEPVVKAFLFNARYKDGTNIEIAINPEFQSVEAARSEAMRYAPALGQLPTTLRRGIRKFSVHRGNKAFHAGHGQIVFYSGTAEKRMTYNHLEESLFHEAVHASWDKEHSRSEGWKKAQADDGAFLTGYGQRRPEGEDLAETALFAYAILHHPDRFPPADTDATLKTVPHRIAYIRKLLPPGEPIFTQVGEAVPCHGATE